MFGRSSTSSSSSSSSSSSDDDDDDDDETEKYIAMAVMTREFLSSRTRNISMKDFKELLSKLETNSFNILDQDLRPIGIGLYPGATMINHDCSANAACVFEGNVVSIRAMRKITCGEEITISYIDTGKSVEKRRKEIFSGFGFLCSCSLCSSDSMTGSRNRMMSGFKCLDEGCTGCVPMTSFQCESCGKKRKEEELMAKLEESKHIFNRATTKANTEKEFEHARKLFEQALSIQTRILFNKNSDLLATLRSLLIVCIDLSDWKAALQYCNATIPFLEFLYQPQSPILGLQFFMLGKLSWHLCLSHQALFWLRKAMTVLSLTHGHENKLYQTLSQLLGQVETETIV